MVEVSPFCGVRYNESLVKDLSTVICPPYDVISPWVEQGLNEGSEYNFVRIEHGRQSPQDTASDNRYTRSAATLEKWLEQGVLITDTTPAIYLHDHFFTYQGRKYRRRGIVVRVRLEEWDKMTIRPHEGTLAEPKSDRLSLLWSLKANTSPIMSLYEDRGRQISPLLSQVSRGKPLISLSQAGGEAHSVWAITEPQMVAKIVDSFAERPLYIADGHHRYESALAYRREQRACSPSISADEPLNFVMMTCLDFADPGLVILPPHRLLRGLPAASVSDLRSKLDSFFDVQVLSVESPDVWQRVDDLLAEPDKISLALFGLGGDELLLLTLRDFITASKLMPHFHSEVYKRLDVSIVDHIILEELLGLNSGQEARITYNYDRQDAVKRVSAAEYQLAFIIKPVRPGVVKAIADVGDRMPHKSTYFYPKLPSGLVFYRLV